MPKISADQLITRGGNLQGAVPPSEKAGLDFAIEMTVDAINYHENGDETDPACCTGDNPCDTRIFLVKRQRELSAQIAEREIDLIDERVHAAWLLGKYAVVWGLVIAIKLVTDYAKVPDPHGVRPDRSGAGGGPRQ